MGFRKPAYQPSPLDRPLVEVVGHATHLLIICTPPAFEGKPCGHRAIMLTADLHAKLPRCKSIGQFKDRLRCSKCGRRGWLSIQPAAR